MSKKGQKPFMCYVCDKSFSVNSAFLTHLRTHTGEKPFTCNVCNTSFALNSDLKRHSTIHTGEKPYSCQECGKKFTRKSYLKIHHYSHTGKKPFVCDLCKKVFPNKDELEDHRRIHTGEKTFVCKICDKSFSQKSNFKKHVLSHDQAALLACCACNTEFSKESDLKLHKCIHSGKRQIACKKCNRRFFKMSSLKKHLRTHATYFCYVCKAKFSKKSDLKAHRSLHKEDKQFACNQCDKTFISDSSLKRHLLVAKDHVQVSKDPAEEALFVCSTCNTKFTQESDLVAHCCVPDEAKQYVCNYCDRSFNREKSLKKHLHVHTKEGAHVCNICNAKFNRGFDLKQHYCIHEVHKQFVCKFCNRRFSKDSSLKKHLHIHFICSVCNTKFSEESDFTAHLLTHAGDQILIDEQDPSSSHDLNLETHDLVHTEAVFFVCNTCDSMFSKVSDLKAHHCIHRGEEMLIEQHDASRSQDFNVETHDPVPAEEAFVCNTCNARFSQESDLKAHHCPRKEEKQFACNQCDRKFSKEGSLKKHIHVHARVASFACSTCNIRFPQESDLNAHNCIYKAQENHIEKQNKISQDLNTKTPDVVATEAVLFVCSFCATIFPQESDLNAHLCIHRVKEILSDKHDKSESQDFNFKTNDLVQAQQAFVCNTCNNRFSQESDLKAHQLIHEAEKRFACNQCNRRFAKDSSLKKHIHVHAKKPSFACSTCKIRFPEESDLKAHRCLYRKEEVPIEKHNKISEDVNLQTPDLAPAEPAILFVCSNCGTLFSQESELKAHHCTAPEGAFLFGKQDKNFIQDFNLQTPDLTQPEQILFMCNTCNTLFSQESELTGHQCIVKEKLLLEKQDKGFIQDCNMKTNDVTNGEKLLFVCNTCGTLFSQESELTGHQCIVRKEEFLLEKQDKSFTQDCNMKTNDVTNAEELLFVCNTCDTIFFQELEFKSHHCITGEEDFLLENNDNSSNSEDFNLKTHGLAKETVYVCNTCKATFSQESELEAHPCIIKKEKLIKIEKQDNSFIQNSNLKTQKLANAKEALFVCNTCEARFFHESEMKAHLCIGREAKFLIDTNDKNSSQDIKPKTHELVNAKELLFACNTCDTRFSRESELKAHICINAGEKIHFVKQDKSVPEDVNINPSLRIQPVEKPFICDICSKSFYDKATLRTHMRVHTRERSFVCSVCKKNFLTESALKTHLHSEIGRSYFA